MIPDALASILRAFETSNSIPGALPHFFIRLWQGCLISQLIITPDKSNGGHLLKALPKHTCAGLLMQGLVRQTCIRFACFRATQTGIRIGTSETALRVIYVCFD